MYCLAFDKDYFLSNLTDFLGVFAPVYTLMLKAPSVLVIDFLFASVPFDFYPSKEIILFRFVFRFEIFYAKLRSSIRPAPINLGSLRKASFRSRSWRAFKRRLDLLYAFKGDLAFITGSL
jgi:hypothetical protein